MSLVVATSSLTVAVVIGVIAGGHCGCWRVGDGGECVCHGECR